MNCSWWSQALFLAKPTPHPPPTKCKHIDLGEQSLKQSEIKRCLAFHAPWWVFEKHSPRDCSLMNNKHLLIIRSLRAAFQLCKTVWTAISKNLKKELFSFNFKMCEDGGALAKIARALRRSDSIEVLAPWRQELLQWIMLWIIMTQDLRDKNLAGFWRHTRTEGVVLITFPPPASSP